MIDGQFIQVKTKDNFTTALEGGEINDSSIAFIEDTNEIWAKNKYYRAVPDGGTDGQVLSTDGTLLKWSTVEGSGVDLSGYVKKGSAANSQLTLGSNDYLTLCSVDKLTIYSARDAVEIQTYGNHLKFLAPSIFFDLPPSTRMLSILNNKVYYKTADSENNEIATIGDLSNYAKLNTNESISFSLSKSGDDEVSFNITANDKLFKYDSLGHLQIDIEQITTNGLYGGPITFESGQLSLYGSNNISLGGQDIMIDSQNITINSSSFTYNGKEVATVDDIAAGSGIDLSDYVKQTQIVQSTGSSTSNIMSQKTVTDALAGKASTDVATTTQNGLMSSQDKIKLNSLVNSSNHLNVDFGVLTSEICKEQSYTPEEMGIHVLNRVMYPTHQSNLVNIDDVGSEVLVQMHNQLVSESTSDTVLYNDTVTFTLIGDGYNGTTDSIQQYLSTYLQSIITNDAGDVIYEFNYPSLTITIKRFWANLDAYIQDGHANAEAGDIVINVDDSNRKIFLAEITCEVPDYTSEVEGWSTITDDMDVTDPLSANLPRKLFCKVRFKTDGVDGSIKYITLAHSNILANGNL